MVEVIKHGYNTYKRICFVCNCEFTYNLCDIDKDKGVIICPDCGCVCHHYPSDFKETSKIKEDNEEAI